MKYLLVVFGNFQKKTKLIKTLSESIAIISEEKSVRYSYGDNVAVINFYSTSDQEDVAIYVDELFSTVSTLFFLTPYNTNVYSSLPMDVHKYLFGESEIVDEDNYNLDDEVDIDQLPLKPDSKSIQQKDRVQQKELSLDEILDKINTEGIYSLTEQERKTLQKHADSI